MSNETPKLKESFQQFKRLFLLIKPYWIKLVKGTSLGVVIGIIGLAVPYLIKLLIDNVYPSQDVTLMQVIVAGILAINITSTLIGTIQGYFNLYVNSKLSNATSLLFFNHLQHLKIRFFDEHRVGEIMSRFSDVSQSLGAVNKVMQTVFVNGIYLLLVPPFLFLLQWKLAIVSLISLPITIMIITLTGKFLRRYWKKSAEAYASLNAFQFEMLTHIRALKVMSLEHHVYSESKKQIENALHIQLKAGGIGQVLGLSNGVLSSLNTALFTWIGWMFILSHQMTLGDYIAFTSYIGYLYNPLTQFVGLFSDFQQSAINLNRMFEYLDSPVEIEPDSSIENHSEIINQLKGDIEINAVTFGYNTDIKVLQDISLNIKPRSIVSIVGSSGSGKTSLLRLLVGMETPDEGNIFYDGIPLAQVPLSDLRKQVSVIWQEFSMFKGSILDNLTIGLNNVNQNDLTNAIKISRMDELINKLPKGLDTPVAEWGACISGGQRQRLAIARAIIRNTPIIIFDEATSNIDLKTEADILKDLFEKEKDKTIIFVTHRIATASLADKICLLENGKVQDFGSHEDLIERCETYRKIYFNGDNRNESLLKIL